MREKISVIIPVYNCESTLNRSLGSLLKQTFTDWEAICVDDGSMDGSARILEEYARKDRRFRIYHKENGGAASARNVGLKAAKSSYIVMLDSDDEFFPDALQRMYEAISATSCDLVTSETEVVRANGIAVCDYIPFKGYMPMSPRLFVRYIRKGPFPFLFKKSIIEQYNLSFPEDLVVAEDYVFTFCYGICSKNIYVLQNPTYRYFYHMREDSLTTRFANLMNDFLDYRANVETPLRVSRFLHSHNFDEALVKQYDYVLCCEFWRMYYMIYNAFAKVGDYETLHKLNQSLKPCKEEMKRLIPWWKWLTILNRYPRLTSTLRKIKKTIYRG